MSRKDELASKIVKKEWEMFQGVNNIGGRASCQDDFATFKIMRISQAMSWSEAALESYLDDLEAAVEDGRNLLSEKYARMMKSTSPLEHARIEHLLPPLAPEAPALIDEIAEIMVEWEEELSSKYPYLVGRGRPVRCSEDSFSVTSFETYLRAELATYSKKTLELYYENILEQKNESVNGSALVLEHQVKQYGYRSLEEANARLKERT